ncbi:MAG: hypothetical protein JWN45_370 [Acidobacteriaceae bacterium]|nr:hypothetical protein [Acidobacteriaceae bacterium]
MFKTKYIVGFAMVFLVAPVFAQEVPAPTAPAQAEPKPATQTPPVKVNILNVCAPSDTEKQEIADALKKVPKRAVFSPDFEVTRGRTSVPGADAARYIRLRRELTGDPVFNVVQYSLSADPKETQEVLVFKAKDPKDLLLISIEDNISASAAPPGTALQTDTPASHVKVERFGKPSIALARCENADQSSYESIFSDSSKVMAGYRKSLGLTGMFRSELAWLSAAPKESSTKPASAKPPSTKTAKNAKPAPPEP